MFFNAQLRLIDLSFNLSDNATLVLRLKNYRNYVAIRI
jgi:hypothetical protein